MNGDMPYFRFYADSWRARLSGLPPVAQALVLQAAAIGWSDGKGGAVRLRKKAWAIACCCAESDLVVAINALDGLLWINLDVDEHSLLVDIPDISSQSKIVVYERDKKRRQRAEDGGQSRGRIDRGRELRKSERPSAVGSAPQKPAAASEEEKHAALRTAIANVGTKR